MSNGERAATKIAVLPAHDAIAGITYRPSVRPSVISRCSILKWLNVRSRKQHHTRSARDPSFPTLKISAKFKRGHPQWRRQIQVG